MAVQITNSETLGARRPGHLGYALNANPTDIARYDPSPTFQLEKDMPVSLFTVSRFRGDLRTNKRKAAGVGNVRSLRSTKDFTIEL